MSNYYWIVNLETPVITLLYISLLSMFHLRSCQFVSPVFTLETTLRLLPEGPWHVSEQPSVLWHDKVPLPYPDSWVQAKCSTARTSLVLLPIYSPKARTNYLQLWGSAKFLSEHRYLKDALGNSMCRITEKSTRLQSSLLHFLTVGSLEHPENVKTENCFMWDFWKA